MRSVTKLIIGLMQLSSKCMGFLRSLTSSSKLYMKKHKHRSRGYCTVLTQGLIKWPKQDNRYYRHLSGGYVNVASQ